NPVRCRLNIGDQNQPEHNAEHKRKGLKNVASVNNPVATPIQLDAALGFTALSAIPLFNRRNRNPWRGYQPCQCTPHRPQINGTE
ncbi:MAG TPA: hypothetical protein VMU34_21890, partial [Mycobacterium sp.]|nr:hypothetical protein [Mycobacterium sp.]